MGRRNRAKEAIPDPTGAWRSSWAEEGSFFCENMKSGEIACLTSSLSSERQHRSPLPTSSQHSGKSRWHEPCSLRPAMTLISPTQSRREQSHRERLLLTWPCPGWEASSPAQGWGSGKGLLGVQGFSESLRSSPQQGGTERGHTCKSTDNWFEGNGPLEACEL